jgi:outer membrane protein assembly factor BamA
VRLDMALLAAIAVVGCSSAGARIPSVEFACEAEKCPVRFDGNAQVSEAELTAVLAQREGPRGDLLPKIAPLLVTAAYYDRGFIDARVSSHAETANDGRHVLVLAIDEGSPYWVKSLTVADPARLPGELLGSRPELRGAISQAVGALFARHVMMEEVRGVLSRYRDTGYAWADADVAVRKEADAHSVSVVITIERGPATVVDRVDISGGDQFFGQALQDRLTLRAGESYRESDVERSSRALAELVGPSWRVDVSQTPVAGHPDRVAVTFGIRWIDPEPRERGPAVAPLLGWSR